MLAARRIERLKTLRAEIEADGGDAHVVGLDVTDPAASSAAVAHAETEMGAIDILVNNSGVSTTQKLIDVTPEDYDYVMDTNTRGAFFVAQEVAKRMIARSKGAAPGTFTGGRIVNIASMAGLRVLAQIGVYCDEQGRGGAHDARDGAGVGPLRHQRQRAVPGLHRHRDQPPPLADRGRPEAGADCCRASASASPQDLDAALMMLCANESHFINGAVIAGRRRLRRSETRLLARR